MKKKTIVFCFVVSFVTVFSAPSSAQFLEAYGIVQQLGGNETTSGDVALKVAGATALGFGMGFNVAKVNLNIDFVFGSTIISSEDTELDAKLFLFDANLDYTFIKGPVSPIVTAGIGSVNFVESYGTVSGLNENDFSYNLGIGIKVKIFGSFLIKGLYRSTWTKIKETDHSIQLDGFCVQLGYGFLKLP